jgi:hypothetical protein
MSVPLGERLRNIFRPGEAERLAAHEFVNQYEKIMPQLEMTGAVLKDVGYRDFDGKRITIYMVSCPQAQVGVVKSLLDRVHITELTASIGVQDESASGQLSLRRYLDDVYETRSFIIYKGKHMNSFDAERLRRAPSNAI